MSNLFIEASRQKLRFPVRTGLISVEDLWDLSLKSLDGIAIATDTRLGTQHGRSFLENPDNKKTREQQLDLLRLDILKVVIATKQEENKATLAAAARRQQRVFLEEVLARKKAGAVEAMSVEDIEAQLAALS